MDKIWIGLFLLVLSCTPCHYVVVERQYGLEEAIPFEPSDIIKMDTLRNDAGGTAKRTVVRIKDCR